MTTSVTASLSPSTPSPSLDDSSVGTSELPLFVLALVSLLPNAILLLSLSRMRWWTSESEAREPSLATVSRVSSRHLSSVQISVFLLTIIDVFCALMTVFNYVDVVSNFSSSSTFSSSSDIADLISPLEGKDGVLFRRRYLVLFFRRVGVLTSHVAVIPFIANRVYKAFIVVRRCCSGRGRAGTGNGMISSKNCCSSENNRSSESMPNNNNNNHHIQDNHDAFLNVPPNGVVTAIEGDPFSSRRHPANNAASVEWREFLVSLLFGVSLPVGVVVVFFVIVPVTFGPLLSPSWIWFYFLLFLLVTFGPLCVVGCASCVLGWRLVAERKRRCCESEAKSETEMNAVRGQGMAPIAATEDLEDGRNDETPAIDRVSASNGSTTSTIDGSTMSAIDDGGNSENRGGSPTERTNFVETTRVSTLLYAENDRTSASLPSFVGQMPNDAIYGTNNNNNNNNSNNNNYSNRIYGSSRFGPADLDQTGSYDDIARKNAVVSSSEDDRVALALGLTLLGCNLSWVWFLMDPRPLSWITFSALGIINSSVNFFLCLICSRRVAAGFRSLCSALAFKVYGK